ncbi:hypothetical protein L1049_014373 [Liquidambar formosana]|uniref:Uncharacterized protein n=1 Tax=Liquidambar formosana TaxID=63359 RepID=A0AAP0WZI8_LIQFO
MAPTYSHLFLSLLFFLLTSPFSSATIPDYTLRLSSTANFPKIQAEKLIRQLNLFPKDPINVAVDESSVAAAPKIVEKRFHFPLVADSGTSIEDLGHHAGYYRLPHSKAARKHILACFDLLLMVIFSEFQNFLCSVVTKILFSDVDELKQKQLLVFFHSGFPIGTEGESTCEAAYLVCNNIFNKIMDLSGNSNWVHAMVWSGQKEFRASTDVPFVVDGAEAGLLKSHGPLSFLKEEKEVPIKGVKLGKVKNLISRGPEQDPSSPIEAYHHDHLWIVGLYKKYGQGLALALAMSSNWPMIVVLESYKLQWNPSCNLPSFLLQQSPPAHYLA